MIQKIYLTAALFLTTAIITAQSTAWTGKFGGDGEDVVLAIHSDAAGNTYTTGYFTSNCDFDITDGEYVLTTNMDFECFVQKTSADGTLMWAKSMGGAFGDYGTKITTNAEGDVYLTGVFQDTADFDPGDGEYLLTSAGSLDIFVVKLRANGDFVWAKNFPGAEYEESNGIGTDSDGNVYVSGYFYSEIDFNPGDEAYPLTPDGGDGFLVKLNKDGDFIWAQKIGGLDFDLATGMTATPNGGVYMSGNFQGTVDFDPSNGIALLSADPDTSGIFLYQVDANGDFVKAVKIGQVASAGYGLSVAVDSTGAAYVTGYIGGQGTFETTGGTVTITPVDFLNGYVAKVEANGSIVWARHLTTTMLSVGYAVAVNSHDELLVSGYFKGTMTLDEAILIQQTSNDIESFVAKLSSSDGHFIWARQCGGINIIDRAAMSVDADDNIYISSAFENVVDIDPDPAVVVTAASAGFRDNFLVKLNDGLLSVPAHTKTSLTVYPNPVRNILHIAAAGAFDGTSYVLYDIAGREVQKGKVANNQIDFTALQTGIYQLSSAGQTFKIIKE